MLTLYISAPDSLFECDEPVGEKKKESIPFSKKNIFSCIYIFLFLKGHTKTDKISIFVCVYENSGGKKEKKKSFLSSSGMPERVYTGSLFFCTDVYVVCCVTINHQAPS